MTKSIFLLTLILCISQFSCKNTNYNHNVVIIGGGLMESATAWHLSKNGKKVLLLEKQDSIYTSGSSFGEARIARINNRGNDIWSYLHNASVGEVKVLIDFLNTEEGAEKYLMSDIYTTSPVTYVGRSRIYDQLISSLERQNIDYKIATNYEQGKELFDVNLPDSVLIQREYNLHSGTINPKALIRYLHMAIKKMGGEVKYNNEVTSLTSRDGIYHLEINDKTAGTDKRIETDRIISAAGPYTGRLLKNVAPYFDSLINPQRVFLAFYKIRKEAYQSLEESDIQKIQMAYPVINSSKGTRDGSFFSMIEYYDDDGIPVIKIGGHFQRSVIEDLDQVWNKSITSNEKNWASSSTLDYFKLLNLPLESNDLVFDHGYSCVYSLTDNGVPYVTPLVEGDGLNKNCIILGGMSGVGAKGAMTYGKIASDLMLEVESDDEMYNQVIKALGPERILEFLSD